MSFQEAVRSHHIETEWNRLTPFQRHMKLLFQANNGQLPAPREWRLQKTDNDVFRETFQFIRSLEDDEKNMDDGNVRLAKKYYERLLKEYAVADLTRYKEGSIGLRWRTTREVQCGKGQFGCGSLHCEECQHLRSYEVHFRYKENGVSKEALVKVRLCPKCAYKLHYKTLKTRKLKATKRESRRVERHSRKRLKRIASDDDTEVKCEEAISDGDDIKSEEDIAATDSSEDGRTKTDTVRNWDTTYEAH
ncbi:MAG: hypothetical protein KVP17_003706 [Porospora cf. gigantea B]|nr:MAG: hypothetical protein KVP17_003706 [Porospora cf. gigantea B]